jgi:hypothetical protein
MRAEIAVQEVLLSSDELYQNENDLPLFIEENPSHVCPHSLLH